MLNDHNPFIMRKVRVDMVEDKRMIFVTPRKVLFEKKEFQGFCSAEENDFLKIIMSSFEFQERGKMEEDPTFKQIIPYVWIVNPKTKGVFAYRRAPDQRYDEARLRDKWSCGLGGHIDQKNISSEDPITEAMLRELQEEVTMSSHSEPKVVGFLNDDENDVGRVHFGVVAVVHTEEASKGDDEMVHGKFYSVEELENVFADLNNNVESWTKLSWPFVKEYVQRL